MTALVGVRRWGDRTFVRSAAKINLHLELLGKRDDGFHELTTLLVGVALWDRMIVESTTEAVDRLEVRACDAWGSLARELPPTGPDNLVLRALAAFREEAPVPSLAILLDKRIPAGAGLGGGSGNAAALLRVANLLTDAPLSEARLHEIAAGLGSDVPFFLGSGPAVGRGRGERLESVGAPLFAGREIWVALLVPPWGCPTGGVYARVPLSLTSPGALPSFRVADYVEDPYRTKRYERTGSASESEWGASSESVDRAGAAHRFPNDLFGPAIAEVPPLEPIAAQLARDRSIELGWGMSGSGSTFFALFTGRARATEFVRRAEQELPLEGRVVSLLARDGGASARAAGGAE